MKLGLKNNLIYKSGKTGQIPLLDSFPNAAAAYSLRYLSSTYTGPVVRIRRSSDNAEEDFTPIEITDGTLTTWTGANDGFVTILYGQSGNSNDAYNDTGSNEPQLVDSGVVITDSTSTPALDFNYAQTVKLRSDAFTQGSLGSDTTTFSVYRFLETVTSSNRFLYDGITTGRNYYYLASSNDDYTTAGLSITTENSIVWELGVLRHNTAGGAWYINNDERLTGTDTHNSNMTGISIGHAYVNGNFSQIYFKELIIYNNNQLANRLAFQNNINSYYSIY